MIVSVLEWAAWGISAILAVWMLADMLKTGREYDEEFLTTSVEGTDELLDPNTGVGGAR
jgi:hypothetical protein